jgi:hypothetical protein
MNVFDSIRQEIVMHAAAANARATGVESAPGQGLAARGLTAEQIVGVLL